MLRPCQAAGMELSLPKKREGACVSGVGPGWVGLPKSFGAKNSIRSFRFWTLDPQDLECALLDFQFICI